MSVITFVHRQRRDKAMKQINLQKTYCEECKKEMIDCECNLDEIDVSFLFPKRNWFRRLIDWLF